MTHTPKPEIGIMPSAAVTAREHGHPARVQQSSRRFLIFVDAILLACKDSIGQRNVVAPGRVDSDIRRASMLGDELGIAELALNDLHA